MKPIARSITPDPGEALRLVIVDQEQDVDVAGLVITETGDARLLTWPDGDEALTATLPTGSRPTVLKMLDLSTCHLPEHLGGGLNGCDGVIASERTHGWLMWVPEDPVAHAADYVHRHGVPSEVVAIQLRARDFGCDYVLFDAAGTIDPSLPTWEW